MKKTFTNYPDFAVPHKQYTRQTIESFSRSYIEDDQKTYENAVETEDGIPEYPVTGRVLAPSTVYRWISTIADRIIAYQAALATLPDKTDNRLFLLDPLSTDIPEKKYKTKKRKYYLLQCHFFFQSDLSLKAIITEFAIISGPS